MLKIKPSNQLKFSSILTLKLKYFSSISKTTQNANIYFILTRVRIDLPKRKICGKIYVNEWKYILYSKYIFNIFF